MTKTEKEIHAIRLGMADILTEVSLLKQAKGYDTDNYEKILKIVGDLKIAFNRENLVDAKAQGRQEGKKEGIAPTVKFFGTIAVAWLIWISSTTVYNTLENTANKNDNKAIRKELKEHKEKEHGH